MTPIFSRSWLMNTTAVFDRAMPPVNLRSAWLISRACRPMCESPMSPSISAFGTSAATESMTTTSTAPERTRISQISSACSPVSGCEISSASTSTPELSRVVRVQRMLRVDVRRDAAGLLGVRDDMQAERRLAARLRSVDLADATARDAPHADRRIEVDRAGRDRLDADLLIRPQPHDRALSAALLDLGNGQIQRLLFVILQGRHSHFTHPLGQL